MSWTEVFIGDFFTDYIQTSRFSTGAAWDVDSSGVPTVKVYEETSDTAVATPVASRLDDAGTVGFYKIQFQVTSPTFSADKRYCVRASATVDSVAGAAILSKFVVRNDHWRKAPSEPTGRAATNEDALGQIYGRLHNKQTKDHTTGNVTVFKADSATAMLAGTDVETDTSSTAGKLS